MRRPRWSFQAWRPRKEDEARKQGRLRNKQGGLDLHILGMREAHVQEALDRLKPRTQKIKTTTELQLLASRVSRSTVPWRLTNTEEGTKNASLQWLLYGVRRLLLHPELPKPLHNLRAKPAQLNSVRGPLPVVGRWSTQADLKHCSSKASTPTHVPGLGTAM